MQVNTLLKPTWIIPIVPEGVVLTKHVIAIADGKIAAIVPESEASQFEAKEVVELHNFANADGSSWQRMVSRLELYGPISMECPASIYRLKKGVCYVSEAIAKPFGSWYNGIADKDI